MRECREEWRKNMKEMASFEAGGREGGRESELLATLRCLPAQDRPRARWAWRGVAGLKRESSKKIVKW